MVDLHKTQQIILLSP